jgi:hypothetical protein
MESILILNKSGLITDRNERTNFNRMGYKPEESLSNPLAEHLISEGGENFLSYLTVLGLAGEQNVMILSARHNYYYDYKDLKGAAILINLRRLNRINHLDSFLNTLCNSLSPKAGFIGCFSDWRISKKIELPSKRHGRFINYLNSGTETGFDRNDISGLLESHRFNVIDMTEINGLTYFRTENSRKIFN